MRRMLETVRDLPEARLRLAGLVATVLGVGLAWLVRG
jgi:uncharacterized protein YjeT (DUF2065 family)